MIGKYTIVKKSIVLKLMYNFNTIPIKIPGRCILCKHNYP